MNKLIERVGRTPLSLVYVGEEPLLSFPTNQQAWEYLSELLTFSNEDNQPWPEEVHVAFMIEDFGNTVSIPQIDKVTKQAGKLKYKGLFGDPFLEFCQRIKNNWPAIKEGLRTS